MIRKLKTEEEKQGSLERSWRHHIGELRCSLLWGFFCMKGLEIVCCSETNILIENHWLQTQLSLEFWF